MKRLRAKGISSFKDYYKYVTQRDLSGEELGRLLDVISTHQTSFFREPDQFTFLANHLLPELITEKIKKGEKKLRIWSVGCSTGEEPYSIAMTLYDTPSLEIPKEERKILDMGRIPDIRIIATDISREVLRKAVKGIYSTEMIKSIPSDQLQRHFRIGSREYTGYYKVKKHLKKIIHFEQSNLFDMKLPVEESMDLIFCRNVIIYFDKEYQKEVIQKLYQVLLPDGYLFLGHAESLSRIPARFKYIQPTIYKKI
jgi:chemotaxis protein methyltransferase CheR